MENKKKERQALEYKGITYVVGEEVIATKGTPYEGLYGHITAIRNNFNKDTDNEEPDIYCHFEPPVLHEDIQKTEKSFAKACGTARSINEIALDEIIMAPEMIMPVPELYRRRKSVIVYVVASEWSDSDYDGMNREMFLNYEDATMAFKAELAREQYNGYIAKMADDPDFIEQEGKDFYQCYIDGICCDYHYSVAIRRETIRATQNDLYAIQSKWDCMSRYKDVPLPVGTRVCFRNHTNT